MNYCSYRHILYSCATILSSTQTNHGSRNGENILCATMKPWFPRWKLETPCLLVETDQGLVLVDTGSGLYDYECPSGIVRFFRSDFGIIRVKRWDTKISPHV
jgi:hypothetical protein